MVENKIQIKNEITINDVVSVKNIIYVKKIFGILLHTVAKMVTNYYYITNLSSKILLP